MSESCVGCKFLYSHGEGYSNYTWMETIVDCALDMNKLLPAEEPFDWVNTSPDLDNWPKTSKERCQKYDEGPYVQLDVDREVNVSDETDDEEAIDAIVKHSGYNR